MARGRTIYGSKKVPTYSSKLINKVTSPLIEKYSLSDVLDLGYEKGDVVTIDLKKGITTYEGRLENEDTLDAFLTVPNYWKFQFDIDVPENPELSAIMTYVHSTKAKLVDIRLLTVLIVGQYLGMDLTESNYECLVTVGPVSKSVVDATQRMYRVSDATIDSFDTFPSNQFNVNATFWGASNV